MSLLFKYRLPEGFHRNNLTVQYNLIIMLCLGSKETDRVICEPCYNEVIYYMYCRKIVIWEPCHGRVILEIVL